MMNIDLVPFSYYGSYMSLFRHDDKLWLQSLHGKSKANMDSIEILITHNGDPVPFKVVENHTLLELISDFGTVEICFDTAQKIVFHSDDNLGIRFASHPKFNFEYNFQLGKKDAPYYVINSYKNLTKYLVYSPTNPSQLVQSLSVDSTGSNKTANNSSFIDVMPKSDKATIAVIQDIPTNMQKPNQEVLNFSDIKKNAEQNFSNFAQQFQLVQSSYKDIQLNAIYTLWSATVFPDGNLKLPAIYASNNKFPGVWSWDHCFMALALAGVDNELAWDQMKVIFQHQDEFGQLPGSVSDSTIRWNFSKPPIHAYTFAKMAQKMTFTDEQLKEIYHWISKQVEFYLNYKDSNEDGICEYDHGNDSGQDNSTVFAQNTVIDSPDLSAYLIFAMDYLIKLSKQLDQPTDTKVWLKKKTNLTSKFENYFFDEDNLPFAREMFTGKKIESQGLLPLVSLIAGNALTQSQIKTILSTIKEHFVTEFGIATEAIDSPLYQDDAYWRGPIWGPSSVIMYEALKDVGEKELAHQIAESFCKTVKAYGFAENFNAKTGVGLRDKSFSWTASAFLYFANELHL
ncbi:amylo-alpha-1,6-glucosidase [Companilactobacillus sp. HBUAS56275]|uniref:amylo-alpha-1,6-glucosidase n=1 Tax=Companilactobacillus sp. HBUAS56275 TaxID=3109364 RepID=UPI002FEFA3D9